MIDTDKLRGVFAERGVKYYQVAEMIGVSPKTFSRKMKRGVFGSDEIEKMINGLCIKNPMEIFFGGE